MAPRLPSLPGARRLPSLPGDDGDGGITPPHLLDAEQEVADDGVDMPPPLLPDSDIFPVLPPHPGWGTWHIEQAEDGEQDHGHGHHHADADAAAGDDDDPLGFGAEPADASLVLAEDGEGPVIARDHPDDGEEGYEEEESVFIPHYDLSFLLQPDEEEDIDREMPRRSDDSEDFDERPMGPICIRGLDDVHRIRSYPHYSVSEYIVTSFRFGHTLDVLHGVRIAWGDQNWYWIGNFKHLRQAARLATTIARLNKQLSSLSSLFQDHCFEKDVILSLDEFLPHLAVERTNLQPALIHYYADAITAALKYLTAQVPTVPCLIDYENLDAVVQYMKERIRALEEEELVYPSDVLPQEQPMLSLFDGNEEDEEEEVNYQVPQGQSPFDSYEEEDVEEDETDSTDSQEDVTLEQFVLISGLSGLEHIRSAPQTYSRSSYYIIESFCFGDVWDLLHGIREISELQGWLWVGNFELLRQVHNIRDTFALLHPVLNRLLQDHHFDRESVSLLEHFIPDLDFTITSRQPPNVRYWVDSIAVALQALLALLHDEVSAESYARDFIDINARVQSIIQRMDGMDRELIRYSQNVLPPEVLPALPGYPPIPLQAPDTSLPTPENAP